MAGNRPRAFECGVVNETVSIRLRTRLTGGFNGEGQPFVQCDQADCQYVDENQLPCPLTLELYADELDERKERAQRRREESY